MTYSTGSLTSANPAADLYTALASALSTAGFTLVDTVVISTRTHKVWKSAAAGNSMTLDWYLDVAYTTTGAGDLWLGAFEGYDATTHLGLRGPYNHSNDGISAEATYYSRFGATASALETNWTHIGNNVARIITQTTAYAYWISATTDRVIIMSSVVPTSLFYCGFFDMYAPWATKISTLAYPLITCTLNSPISVDGQLHSTATNLINAPTLINNNAFPAALTRQPPVLHTSNNVWAGGIYSGWNAVASAASLPEGGEGIGGPAGRVDTGVSSFYDTPRGGNLAVYGGWNGVSPNPVIGTLKDICVFVGSAVTRGDTISISSTDWVLTNIQSALRCYGFKAV